MTKMVSDSYSSMHLDPRDVIYVYLRDGVEKSDYVTVEIFKYRLPFLSFRDVFKFSLKAIMLKMYGMRRIDGLIEDIVSKQEFYVYVPHLYSQIISFFYSNDLCRGLFLIEEGDAAYVKNSMSDPSGVISFRNSKVPSLLLRFLGLDDRVLFHQFFPEREYVRRCIGLSDSSFPLFSDLLVTLDPTNVFSRGSYIERSCNSLFLIDPFVLQGKIPESDYIEALDRFLFYNELEGTLGDVFVSFHPTVRQDHIFCRKILDVFKENGILFEVFEGNIEKMLVRAKDCSVFGLRSSSMRYAKILGLKVFSWANYFDTVNSDFLVLLAKANQSLDVEYL